MTRNHTPEPPTARHRNDVSELDARMVARAAWQPRQESGGETWLSRWAPYPTGIRRGPYAHPTRTNLTKALAGLEKVLAVIQDEDATTAALASQMPALEPVPVPECLICKAAHNRRTLCRARQDERGVRTYSEVIAGHPHPATDQGVGW
ncbi:MULTISPECIES: hypothetical protein [unclassified Streptomyces]|uniref:hypothetical protein n=1 Tax=unclassified Streptomyces TaxID=2593676 RepID=UPI000899319F|nr:MULTISPECIES: hypothetical protein [unclassified Streptomyces]PBC84619.1 hypothetical protein BX261_4613 [Streptomyces sp. 2321.6]SED38144.1 hypothetical protein SAMN05428940_4641 [Streptomyces sp. 2133.1]